MNCVILDGRLTRDVDLRYTPSGKAVANMSIAINEGTKEKPETYFAEVTIWDKQAENCKQYLEKGSRALIEGRLTSAEWTDKTTGEKRSKTVIVARRVQFLDNKSDNIQAAPQGAINANNNNMKHYEAKANGYQQERDYVIDPKDAPPRINDEDIPF